MQKCLSVALNDEHFASSVTLFTFLTSLQKLTAEMPRARNSRAYLKNPVEQAF
jgi:hypothetical protein